MQNIGKYQVLQVLGRGGMGTVYEALDPHIGRKVAIKTMSPGFADNPDLKARFLREAQAAGGLRHRNIVTVYDLGEDSGQPYITMELIEGRDLDKIIQSREPITLDVKLDILRQICDGLARAHRNGIVHRDVKPQNIRVTPEGEVKIMDFGIAHLQASSLTGSGLVLGTVHYMSPEQVQGRKVDHRADIFSVGAMAYELLAYRKPFAGESLTEVMYKVTHEGADPKGLPRTQYSPRLERVVMRALAADPDQRYQSLDEMLAELQALVPADTTGSAPQAEPAEAEAREGEMAESRAEVEQAHSEGQLQRALALCEKILAQSPDDAWALRRAQEIQAAIQDREVEQLSGLALSYAADGDTDLAEKIATRIHTMAPDSPRYAQLRQYLDDEARRREAEALTATAREHLVHGNLEEALACAEAALEIEPQQPSAREIQERTSRILASQRPVEQTEIADAVPAEEPAPDGSEAVRAAVPVPAEAAGLDGTETVAMSQAAPPPGSPGESEHASRPPAAAATVPETSGPRPPSPRTQAASSAPAPSRTPGRAPSTPPAPAPHPERPAPAGAARESSAPPVPKSSEPRPPDVEALMSAALNAFVLNDYATARKKVQRALALDPGNRRAIELAKILGALA